MFKRIVRALDLIGLFTEKKDRLKEAMEQDRLRRNPGNEPSKGANKPRRWYHYVTPQTVAYICSTAFLNRTKASLRLKYDPLFDPEEAKSKSIDWYKNHLKL